MLATKSVSLLALEVKIFSLKFLPSGNNVINDKPDGFSSNTLPLLLSNISLVREGGRWSYSTTGISTSVMPNQHCRVSMYCSRDSFT